MVALDGAPDLDEVASHPKRGIHVGGPHVLWKRIEYGVLIGHICLLGMFGAAWALYHGVSWVDGVNWLIGFVLINVGVGVGYHRYLTHQSFETSKPMRYVIATLAQMACQGSALHWVADHRRHHAHADRCGDTHSPYTDGLCNPNGSLKGLFHSHIGWLMDNTATDLDVFARDLQKDEVIMWAHRTRWFWVVFSLWIFPTALSYALLGGDMGLADVVNAVLIGGYLRTFVMLQFVLAVNSIGHMHGEERFDNHGHAKNNWLLALLTFGDGWHNNHHAHPRNAYAGLRWWEVDFNGYLISGMEKVGLVWKVIRTPRAEAAKHS